jgi:hypothetical protein
MFNDLCFFSKKEKLDGWNNMMRHEFSLYFTEYRMKRIDVPEKDQWQ